MASTLRDLTINGCDALASSEIKHVLSLRHLTSLELTYSFDSHRPLDECSMALLTPPTLALPSLVSFEYAHVMTDLENEIEDDPELEPELEL